MNLEELKIEVTYKCPLTCIHCSSDAAPNIILEIEESKCLQIIDDAVKMGVQEIAFSGGEPLIYTPLLKCVEKASKMGVATTVYSSGNIDNYEECITKLIDAGLNRIIFSLYSANASRHQIITRKTGSFAKTIAAIKISVQKGIKNELHFVALKSTFKDLADVVDLAKVLGLHKISILRFVPQGRGAINNKETLTQEDYLLLKKDIERLRKKFDIRTGSPFNFLLLNNEPLCLAAYNKMIINPNLDVFPCDAFKQMPPKEVIGEDDFSNLGTNSLGDCWNKSLFLNKVREYLREGVKEPCHECGNVKLCQSGCLAQKVLAYQDFRYINDPNCIAVN
jgi:radical SAM protein with 4Fe4S-binding SPASM domain